MLRSIATVSLSGTLPEKLEAASAARFDGVEIFEADLTYFDGSARDARQLASNLGLEITLFQPFRDFEGAPRERRARNLDRAERKFDLMGELGVGLLLLCSNVAPDTILEDEAATEDLAQVAERAAARGIRDRLRGPGLGPACAHLVACLAHRPGRGPAEPGPSGRQLPHALAGRRSLGPGWRAGRTDLLRPDGGRPAPGDGRALLEPPFPLLPGPGRLRPRGLPGPCRRQRLWRPDLARGLQRRLPRGVGPADRRRWDALAPLSRGEDPRAPAGGTGPAAFADPCGALRPSPASGYGGLRVHRVRGRGRQCRAPGRLAGARRLHGRGPPSLEERHLVPSGRRQPGAQRRARLVRARLLARPRALGLCRRLPPGGRPECAEPGAPLPLPAL